MLKSPKHEPPGVEYPINTEVFETFISSNGFVGTTISEENTEWVKNKTGLHIPHVKTLKKEEVRSLLFDAELTIEDFEAYIEHIQATRVFDLLVDQSLKTKHTLKK